MREGDWPAGELSLSLLSLKCRIMAPEERQEFCRGAGKGWACMAELLGIGWLEGERCMPQVGVKSGTAGILLQDSCSALEQGEQA